MVSRLTICIYLLAGQFSLALAQDMHVFSNGSVADAEKINDNFAAVDQTGPEISFAPRVVGPDGLAGSVMVTISDPSGLFGYGNGHCYPCASDSPWKAGDQRLVFDGETTISVEEYVGTSLNEVTNLVFFATDLRGNKSVKRAEYAGPSSRIRGGLYRAREPFVSWQTDYCGDSSSSPEIPIRHMGIGVWVPQGAAYPTLAVNDVHMCEEASEDFWTFGSCESVVGLYYYGGNPEEGGIPITPDADSLSISHATYNSMLFTTLTYSADSLELSATVEERCLPSLEDGQGPFEMTLDYLERP